MYSVFLGVSKSEIPWPTGPQYTWLNGHHYHWFQNFHKGFKTTVKRISAKSTITEEAQFPLLDYPGPCIIMRYMPQSITYVQGISCDVPTNVFVYCSFTETRQLVSSSLSTINVHPIHNGFTAIEWGTACNRDESYAWDVKYWFQQGDMCVNVQTCIGDCTCQEGRPAYTVLQQQFHDTIEHGKIITPSSILGKFINVFKSREVNLYSGLSIDYMYIAFDSLKTVGIKFPRITSNDEIMSLRVPVLKAEARGLWAVTGDVEFVYTNYSAHYILCERETVHMIEPIKCEYFSCNDGTCLAEKLLCDGTWHCVDGEDEANCTAMCSSNEVENCLYDCSYEYNCRCARSYFQCQSGGCIPVGKLCDGAADCIDKSDEHMSCFLSSSDQQWKVLETEWKQRRARCSYTNETFIVHQSTFGISHKATATFYIPCDLTGMGTSSMACNNFRPSVPLCFGIHHMCVYELNVINYPSVIYPCVNGYHLAQCEHMHCQHSFKCPRSYCVRWVYTCDDRCDCPYCEDESICNNVTCPGLLLQSSSRHKVMCRQDGKSRVWDFSSYDLRDRFSALIMYASTYNEYETIQRKMCKSAWCDIQVRGTEIRSNIVYLDLQDGTHLSDHPRINTYLMQFVIFCNITRYNIELEDAYILENLTLVQYLDLSDNRLQNNISFIFLRITQLIFLDLSTNIISHFSMSFLCMSPQIKYLFLHNNILTSLDAMIFHPLKQLRVVYLQNNQLSAFLADVLSFFPLESALSVMWSDIPQLCCMVNIERECKPPFQFYFLTCENMIQSQLQVAVSWTVGVITSSCNFIAAVILLVAFTKWNVLSKKQRFTTYLSLNIIISDFTVSVSLLSLSFHNIRFHGVFGIYADQWRSSIQCAILELLLFVCTECSLLFSVYLLLHTYFNISSMAQSHICQKRAMVIIAAIWIMVFAIGICKIIVWNIYNANEYNYYCLPFQVTKLKQLGLVLFLAFMIIANTILMAIYIVFQVRLLQYVRKHVKETSKSFESKVDDWKINVKSSFIIASNVVTWTPILILQLLIIFGAGLNPSTVFLILLVSLPSNLLIHPIIMATPFVSFKTSTCCRTPSS